MNFFKPTKVTWIVFGPLAVVTLAPVLLIFYFALLWAFDPGSSSGSIGDIMKSLFSFVALVAGEYVIASLTSFIWYRMKSKAQK